MTMKKNLLIIFLIISNAVVCTLQSEAPSLAAIIERGELLEFKFAEERCGKIRSFASQFRSDEQLDKTLDDIYGEARTRNLKEIAVLGYLLQDVESQIDLYQHKMNGNKNYWPSAGYLSSGSAFLFMAYGFDRLMNYSRNKALADIESIKRSLSFYGMDCVYCSSSQCRVSGYVDKNSPLDMWRIDQLQDRLLVAHRDAYFFDSDRALVTMQVALFAVVFITVGMNRLWDEIYAHYYYEKYLHIKDHIEQKIASYNQISEKKGIL